MARSAALIGIATGIVALTAVAALAVGGSPGDDQGSDGHPAGLQHPRGQDQAEWARGHHGPPPWSQGQGHDKGHAKDHGEDHGKHKGWDKQKDKQDKDDRDDRDDKDDKDEERSS